MSKLSRQLISLLLALLMVLESGFNACITGYAAEEPVGTSSGRYAVKAVAKLSEEEEYQVVPYGTALSRIGFPKFIYALAADEDVLTSEEDDYDSSEDQDIYVATASEAMTEEVVTDINAATDSEIAVETVSGAEDEMEIATQSVISKDIDYMSDEQKVRLVELLSGDEKPDIKELEEETGLKLSSYRIIKLPLEWTSDAAFGGEYNPEEAGTYLFTAEVKNEEK